MHDPLSPLYPPIDDLSGACVCVCAQIIDTLSAFLWADCVSGTVLVLSSTVQREQSVWVSVSWCFSLSCLRSSRGSPERLDVLTAEGEEGDGEEGSSVLSEGIDHSNILAYLRGTNSTSRQREWTPERSVL